MQWKPTEIYKVALSKIPNMKLSFIISLNLPSPIPRKPSSKAVHTPISHTTFYPQFFLPARCVEAMVLQNSWEWPTRYLIQLEVHARRGNPCLALPGWPGTRDWIAQRPIENDCYDTLLN